MSDERHVPASQATSLLRETAFDLEGRELGKVRDLVLDVEDGRVTAVVIGTGGVLGIHETQILVPWESVTIDAESRRLLVHAIPASRGGSGSPPEPKLSAH